MLNLRVMVVDQDRDYRGAVSAMLERRGFVCEPFESARHALIPLESFMPQVIVIDLDDPDAGSFVDVVAELREGSTQIGVVAVVEDRTITHQVADAVVGRHSGIDEVVRAVLYANDVAALRRG